jgi:hypothetical protein
MQNRHQNLTAATDTMNLTLEPTSTPTPERRPDTPPSQHIQSLDCSRDDAQPQIRLTEENTIVNSVMDKSNTNVESLVNTSRTQASNSECFRKLTSL